MAFTRATYSRESTRENRRHVNARSEWFKDDPASKRRRFAYGALATLLTLVIGYATPFYMASHFKPVPVPSYMTVPNPTAQDLEKASQPSFDLRMQSAFLKRTFIRQQQALSVHYRIPEGAVLDLHIRQCRRAFVLEVYMCLPKSQQTIRIDDKTTGLRSLHFTAPGFYHFSNTLTLPDGAEDYTVVWVRNEKPASDEAGS